MTLSYRLEGRWRQLNALRTLSGRRVMSWAPGLTLKYLAPPDDKSSVNSYGHAVLLMLVPTGKETSVRSRPDAQEWYFFKAGSDAGLKAGPFSWERLLKQADSGTLEPTDVVWDPNSGWKTGAQVPGLFPSVPPPVMEGTFSDILPLEPAPGGRGRSRIYWVSALVALVMVGGGLGAYFGFAGRDGDGLVATTTTEVATTQSTTQSTTQTSTTNVTSTTMVTSTSVAGGSPARYLGKSDFGDVVTLRVGDRVRIDLQPWVGDKVKSVEWDYRRSLAQEIDSGTQMVDGAVVASWVELQAVAAGRVTVRANYHYPNGSSKAIWVVYLLVK
jgi:hypothetical protein